MTRRRFPFAKNLSAVPRYGLAAVSVAFTLGIALLLQKYHFRGAEFPVFLFAIAVTVWYLGPGPGVLAVVLSTLLFNWFFTEPLHTLYVKPSELAYYVMFVVFALLVAWFAAIRRRVERDLLQSRDDLQKEVEIRTQQASLLNLTHDTIFVRDMNDVITYWNRGAQELYGWTEAQALGKNAHELLQSEFPKSAEEVRAEFLSAGRWDGELQKTKADGARVVVASRWSLQRNERGEPAAILETNNDISDRKRREEEISKLNEELGHRTVELEATNKELEAFAYSVSHDLRAPLRHVSGYTELLQKNISSALNEKTQRYMMTILDSAKRMGNLIDDLLAFSRIGRAEARESTVSLEQLVTEVVSEVKADAGGRAVTWNIGPLPNVYGDRSMLRLALVNLVSNAVKFTRDRAQPQIQIGCSESDNENVVVFVRDNGVGFDMKYSNKLFGVFQRLHPTESFEGTGIGLATVQRIIHRHRGKVWAEGLVGQGATFFFSVPGYRR